MRIRIDHPTNRPNYSILQTPDYRVVFSYATPIAFHTWDSGWVVRENDFSTTTGKHLNMVDGGSKEDKEQRVTGVVFEAGLAKVLDALVPWGDA